MVFFHHISSKIILFLCVFSVSVRAQITFVESAEEAGIQSSCMANGGAFGDFTGDDLPDLFVACLDGERGSLLYKNLGAGVFKKTDDAPGKIGHAMGGIFVDVDHDGDRDLYAVRFNRPNLVLINDGGLLRGLPDSLLASGYRGATSASFADFDHDGVLDLFSVHRYANPNQLFLRPSVNGFDAKPQMQSTLSAGRESFSSTVFDYDSDGALDLYVAQFGYEDALHRNDGHALFIPVGQYVGFDEVNYSVAGIPADYDSDGDIDLYVIQANEQANTMWRNDEGLMFRAATVGAEGAKSSAGATAADFDLDGDLDILVSNIGGIDVYNNNGNGNFENISSEALPSKLISDSKTGGIATGDYDQDGDIDAFLSGLDGRDVLLKNQSRVSNWLKINWEAQESGTKVHVVTENGDNQLHTVALDSRLGSVDDKTTIIGLSHDQPVRLRLTWPSGHIQHIENIDPRDNLTLSEPLQERDLVIGYVQLPENLRDWGQSAGLVEIYNRGSFPSEPLPLRARIFSGTTLVYEQRLPISVMPPGERTMFILPGWAIQSGGFYKIQISIDARGNFLKDRGWEREIYLHGFTDVAADVGVADPGAGWAAALADGDGDGDIDIYVSNGGSFGSGDNVYFRNDGGRFTDITASNGTADVGNGTGVTFADFDGDGDQDLFMSRGGFLPPGESNRLLYNDGNANFIDVTNDVGLDDVDASYAAVAGDYDGDGRLDLYVSQFRGQYNALYHNEGAYFTNQREARRIVSYQRFSGAAAAFSDFDLDGDVDLYASMFGTFDVFYADIGEVGYERAQVGDEGDAVGITLGDYDADGDQDVYVVNQSWRSTLWRNDSDKKTFVDVGSYSGVENHASGTGCSFGDYDNDGDLDLFVVNGVGANRVYMNRGDGTFQDVAPIVGMADTVRTRAVVLGDYDGDGDLDPYVVNEKHPNRLYRNDGNNNNWLQVNLRGGLSNPDAIGTKLTLSAKNGPVVREVNGVSGLAQSSRIIQFGLGPAGVADSLTIQWPTGNRQVVVPIDGVRRLFVIEGETPTLVSTTPEKLPDIMRLEANYPNPFNGVTVIPFVLPNDDFVSGVIYNILGQPIRHLMAEKRGVGAHHIVWDGLSDNGRRVGSGVYYFGLKTSKIHMNRPLLLVR